MKNMLTNIKLFSLCILISLSTFFSAVAQNNCMTVETIKALDAQWEANNLAPDPEFFRNVLAENFVWVHNHASMIDTKEAVIKRAENQAAKGSSDTRSRIQSEVEVAITGNVAVVTGFTIVDRGPVPTTYHFMRTYVEIDGKCLLTGNHTMAVPVEE
ncbi:nuclear transport factor 2 family protein [Algoriphagus persicinus]|uniref:nuclear transport factor 2 family protein n=1 Tax=Algoriphagus persicinus TaxID=3108754 RepID=UPI002B40B1D9|nr:nuclear transport factor 2 family protein [Algoriphagus sp. E1-3-M2]